MKLSKREREVLWFYGIENFLVFLQIIIVFGMFIATEDLMYLIVELGLSGIIALNEVRAKL